VFLLEVVVPVGVVVVVGVDCPVPQDGLGAGGAPAGAGDARAVVDDVAAGAFDDAGSDRPSVFQCFGVVEVGLLGAQVGQDPGDVLRVLGAPGGCWRARRVIVAMTSAERPCRMSRTRAVVQASMAGSRGSWNAQAAFHRYSMTWIRSIRMVTATPRAAASASIRAIWCLSPSTRTIQGLSRPGSRRPASSNSQVTDADRSAVMSAR